jgi:hypothetical protein
MLPGELRFERVYPGLEPGQLLPLFRIGAALGDVLGAVPVKGLDPDQHGPLGTGPV